MRSYQGYYTRSHQNSEVKRLWAGIVLGWVTSREVPVLHPLFSSIVPLFLSFSRLLACPLSTTVYGNTTAHSKCIGLREHCKIIFPFPCWLLRYFCFILIFARLLLVCKHWGLPKLGFPCMWVYRNWGSRSREPIKTRFCGRKARMWNKSVRKPYVTARDTLGNPKPQHAS